MKPGTCTEDMDKSVLVMFCIHTEGDVWGWISWILWPWLKRAVWIRKRILEAKTENQPRCNPVELSRMSHPAHCGWSLSEGLKKKTLRRCPVILLPPWQMASPNTRQRNLWNRGKIELCCCQGECCTWLDTGVHCHFLLQGIFPTQESNPGLPHCRQTLLPSEPQSTNQSHISG